jgi:hypothetical protein
VKKIITILILLICALALYKFFYYVSTCHPEIDEKYIHHIEFERVLMNQADSYTFISNGKIIKVGTRYEVSFHYTVPPGGQMYATYTEVCNAGSKDKKNLNIYIHSPKDIGAGGWNHGKFGRGQMSVIE